MSLRRAAWTRVRRYGCRESTSGIIRSRSNHCSGRSWTRGDNERAEAPSGWLLCIAISSCRPGRKRPAARSFKPENMELEHSRPFIQAFAASLWRCAIDPSIFSFSAFRSFSFPQLPVGILRCLSRNAPFPHARNLAAQRYPDPPKLKVTPVFIVVLIVYDIRRCEPLFPPIRS